MFSLLILIGSGITHIPKNKVWDKKKGNFKMKKIICLLLIFSLLTTSSVAFAVETEANRSQINPITVSPETVTALSLLPVFITYIDYSDEDNIDDTKELACLEINDAFKSRENTQHAGSQKLTIDESSALHINNSTYEIIEVADASKAEMLNRPEFASTINRIGELVDQGVSVNYVNFFLSQNGASGTRGDPSDPAYWEGSCPKLCPAGGSNVYNGYKFLYIESAVNVETTPKVAGNIGSMNWTSVAAKITKLAADVIVKNAVFQVASVAYDALSAVFSGYQAPYSVTYSASSGYLKTWVSGDLYMRTILISDNLNRIAGYAYYDWGHLESFKAKTKVDAKWPVSVRPGGTYNYETNTYAYSTWRYATTPGFNGNTTLYSSVINLYQNTIGYFTHAETVDINGMIASLV